MAVDRETIDRVAKLARLELDPSESELLTAQMARIVQFVEKINELDTTGIEPSAHVLGISNVTRPDTALPSVASRDAMLALAPVSAANCIVVPRVIE